MIEKCKIFSLILFCSYLHWFFVLWFLITRQLFSLSIYSLHVFGNLNKPLGGLQIVPSNLENIPFLATPWASLVIMVVGAGRNDLSVGTWLKSNIWTKVVFVVKIKLSVKTIDCRWTHVRIVILVFTATACTWQQKEMQLCSKKLWRFLIKQGSQCCHLISLHILKLMKKTLEKHSCNNVLQCNSKILSFLFIYTLFTGYLRTYLCSF